MSMRAHEMQQNSQPIKVQHFQLCYDGIYSWSNPVTKHSRILSVSPLPLCKAYTIPVMVVLDLKTKVSSEENLLAHSENDVFPECANRFSSLDTFVFESRTTITGMV